MAGEPKNEPPFTNPVGGTTPPPPNQNGSLLTVRSASDLRNIAAGQVDDELSGQIQPLQGQYDLLGKQENRVLGDIGGMFGSILPAARQGAENVAESYAGAEQSQQAIMSAATQRLNDLKQSAAQRAQMLAQEMGGPVAINSFTDPVSAAEPALANLGAGQMLHTLGFAEAGVQQSRAFADQVLPLVQTEQEAQARNKFEDQRKTIQDQITTLKGTRASKVNTKLNDLLTQERTYALQKNQQQLDKLKATRDWQATRTTLADDSARIQLARKQFELQLDSTKFQQTVTKTRLSDQEKQFADQYGLSVDQFKANKAATAARTRLATQQLTADKQKTYADYLDAAVNPQPGKTITNTVPVQVSDTAALTGKIKDAYKGKDGHYYHLVTTKQTVTTDPITDPTALVDFLTAHNVPKKTAVAMVKSRLQLPNWTYGQANPNDTSTGAYSGHH